jgi:[acyl-carrier-protein] S-malonyltransferase
VTAFLFAGQGVEPPWVSPELLRDPCVAALIGVASEAVRIDVARLLARGGRELACTEVLQPALVAVCLGIDRRLAREGLRPVTVLGHSLGEFAAWAAAGGISAEDAVRLAAARGALMARAASRRPGGMLRIACDRQACEHAVAAAARSGAICIAAHNGPDEYVVSGDPAPLAELAARFPSARLPVAGAWHSPAMADATAELAAAIAAVPQRPLRARLIANRDGRFVDAADVPERLVGQLVRPVEWAASLATLATAGPLRLLAIGPGKLLRQLVRRNLGDAREVEIVDGERAIVAAVRGADAVA